MALRKFKFSVLALVLLAALSTASYGYLLGKHQGFKQQDQLQQVENVAEKITTGGTVVTRAVHTFKRLVVK